MRYAVVVGFAFMLLFAPSGTRAQFSFRVDVARVRSGGLEGPARELFAATGEWRLLFEGSGIDAASDLDRFSFETPPRDMSRAVVVARHRHDPDWVRARAEALAQARGERVEWRTEHGVPVTSWLALDHRRRPRVLAILGPSHFAVGRADDVFALLVRAGIRGERPRPAALRAAFDRTLTMDANVILMVNLLGLQEYFSHERRVAQSVSVTFTMDGYSVDVEGNALMDNEPDATRGARVYTELASSPPPRRGHPGMFRLLRYEPIARSVHVSGTLDPMQARDEIEYQAEVNAQRGIVQRL